MEVPTGVLFLDTCAIRSYISHGYEAAERRELHIYCPPNHRPPPEAAAVTPLCSAQPGDIPDQVESLQKIIYVFT